MQNKMDQYEFINFKSNLERLSIPNLIATGPQLLDTSQKSDIFWLILERKIRTTIWYKGKVRSRYDYERTPALSEVLSLKSPKPPLLQVLRTFIEMGQSIEGYKRLVDSYPDSVNVQLQNGDLLLHRVIKIGGFREKDFINSIICTSIILDVGKGRQNKFGGLTTKNNAGRSPLTMLFGIVVIHVTRNPHSARWIWLKNLIQRVVHIQLHYKGKCKGDLKQDFDNAIFENDCLFSKELRKTPLVHAALQIDCPLGLLNRIVDSCTIDELSAHDSFGRTPLVVALSNKASYAEIVMKLFRRTPVKVLQLLNIDKEGDMPLHRILKGGIKYHSRSGENDLSLVATVAGIAPHALHTGDDIHKMPPFMLACINDQWSLDVVFGLLRSGPFAIEPFV